VRLPLSAASDGNSGWNAHTDTQDVFLGIAGRLSIPSGVSGLVGSRRAPLSAGHKVELGHAGPRFLLSHPMADDREKATIGAYDALACAGERTPDVVVHQRFDALLPLLYDVERKHR
jgi:hypothetical protein